VTVHVSLSSSGTLEKNLNECGLRRVKMCNVSSWDIVLYNLILQFSGTVGRGFQVVTPVTVQSSIFGDITPCSLVEVFLLMVEE
jgi:hypothetical protein